MKKYELTEETVEVCGNVLHRIVAASDFLSSFGSVKKGDLGGFIQSENNLSKYGNSWVSGNAKVFGGAFVVGSALVYGNAEVYGNAWVAGNAEVYGNAKIYSEAKIFGNTMIFGETRVCGEAKIYGQAAICGDATVMGNARVFGCVTLSENVVLSNDVCISSVYDYICVGPIGPCCNMVMYVIESDMVSYGCWSGSLYEFDNAKNMFIPGHMSAKRHGDICKMLKILKHSSI